MTTTHTTRGHIFDPPGDLYALKVNGECIAVKTPKTAKGTQLVFYAEELLSQGYTLAARDDDGAVFGWSGTAWLEQEEWEKFVDARQTEVAP